MQKTVLGDQKWHSYDWNAGMGHTHSDEEIWSLVAFMQALPNLGPDEYKRMVELAKSKGSHMQPGNESSHSGHSH